MNKPIHVKPSLYAFYFEMLKEIALKYGYNLVLHGSMNRDLDLIAIPWQEEIRPHLEMVKEMAEAIGGKLHWQQEPNPNDKNAPWLLVEYRTTHHGRMWYIIDIYRGGYHFDKYVEDPQFYIDLSIMPTLKNIYAV